MWDARRQEDDWKRNKEDAKLRLLVRAPHLI